jgi:hypothetical protein
MFAGGSSELPNVASLNYAPGQTKSNSAVVPIGPDGKISLYSDSSVPVDVVLDVTGYVAGTATGYVPTTPTRLLDTRAPVGSALRAMDPLTASTTGKLDIRRLSVVPVGAKAVVLNVTAVSPTTVGNLRVFADSGESSPQIPVASSLNYIVGRAIGNLVVVAVPTNGLVDFYDDQLGGGKVDLTVDVVGYVMG